MKRIGIITLILLTMIGLFIANQTSLLAEASGTGRTTATAHDAMLAAGQLYETGQYTQAAQAYQQLADQGFADSALFYNLGNAYFKQGDYGRAILNYRRAQQFAPRDPDVEANLALARSQTTDKFAAAEETGILTLVGDSVQGRFTLNEVAMAALGAWMLLVFGAILFASARADSIWRKALQYALLATAVVLAVGILALGSSLYVTDGQSEAIVVAAEVDVSSGPGSQYVTKFTLHSGAEVNLLEARGSWARLAVPGGELKGWVPVSAVEAVDG
jgi:tetratricopeptide (TPR) repeat protein